MPAYLTLVLYLDGENDKVETFHYTHTNTHTLMFSTELHLLNGIEKKFVNPGN